jgi:hypothetical protein
MKIILTFSIQSFLQFTSVVVNPDAQWKLMMVLKLGLTKFTI